MTQETVTYEEISEELNSCISADDMQKYAQWLYTSGALDESEQVFSVTGPLAPWSLPDAAEEFWTDGADMLVMFPDCSTHGLNWAYWDNSNRSWREPRDRDFALAGTKGSKYAVEPGTKCDRCHEKLTDDERLNNEIENEEQDGNSSLCSECQEIEESLTD